MVETTAKIIRSARQSKYYLTFSEAEFDFISRNENLSANEKLIWLNIARKAQWDENLRCGLTHSQISKLIGIKPDTVYRAIKKLKEKGFLDSSFDDKTQIVTYTIMLPEEGLDSIRNAPKRGEKLSNCHNTDAAKNVSYLSSSLELENAGSSLSTKRIDSLSPSDLDPEAGGLTSGTPSDQSPILIINNNNKNNNQSNNLDSMQVRIHESLVFDYLNLMKKYSNLSFKARVKQIKEHFSEVELQRIHLELIEIQKGKEIVRKNEHQHPSTLDIKSDLAVKHIKKEVFTLNFEGNIYLIEEKVRNHVFNQLPSLYEAQKENPNIKNRTLSNVLNEILYFICKVNISEKVNSSKSLSQMHKFYIARKKLLEGKWQIPFSMITDESIRREKHAQENKLLENKYSKELLMNIGIH